MDFFNKFKNKYDITDLNTLFRNKNILVFDLETTGFIKGQPKLDKNYEACMENIETKKVIHVIN